MSEPTKRPVGRPSEYDPAYCERVIRLGREGKSKVVIAAELGVTKPTIENWCRQHPEFLSAMETAMTLSQAWWENAGQKGLTAEKFNASIWSRSMAARFPEDWRENSRHEHTGVDGGPIRHEIDLSALSDEELETLDRIRSKLSPQSGGDPGGEASEGAGG